MAHPRGFTPKYDETVTIAAAELEGLIARRLYDLRFHLIDRLVVTLPSNGAAAATAALTAAATGAATTAAPNATSIAARLAPFGYRPIATDPAASTSQAQIILGSPRITQPQVDGFRNAEARAATLARYGITCRGAIQIGAHVGQEVAIFKALGARHVILVEANPSVYQTLQHNVRQSGVDALLANCAITNFDGETELMLASFDQSSSLLPLAHHSVEYPQIRAVGSVKVPARKLDTLITQDFRVDPAHYNVLEIDVQGAESLVLQGATAQLRHVDAVYVEINYKPMYEGCQLIDSIDAMLLDAGLIRVEYNCAYSPNWGDALYIRKPRVVSMCTLGTNGRLGNQVLQYAYLAVLCQENALTLQVPACDLASMFEPAATVASLATEDRLPEAGLISLTPFSEQSALCAQGQDLKGYFQFHTRLWHGRQAAFRQALTLNPVSSAREQTIRAALTRRGYCIAIHYRQGDFNQFRQSPCFYIAPLAWYVDAIKALPPSPDTPYVYLASDSAVDTAPLRDAGITVLTSSDLLDEIGGDATTLDFLALKNADTMMISNSTFSFAASLLNEGCRVFLRPDRTAQRLVPFDPWNSPVLMGLEHEAVRFAG